MKKNWSNPEVKNLDLNNTKTDIVECPYVIIPYSMDETETPGVPQGQLGAEACCPCQLYAVCNNKWKYTGACNS